MRCKLHKINFGHIVNEAGVSIGYGCDNCVASNQEVFHRMSGTTEECYSNQLHDRLFGLRAVIYLDRLRTFPSFLLAAEVQSDASMKRTGKIKWFRGRFKYLQIGYSFCQGYMVVSARLKS
jgi:hypothetical protein